MMERPRKALAPACRNMLNLLSDVNRTDGLEIESRGDIERPNFSLPLL